MNGYQLFRFSLTTPQCSQLTKNLIFSQHQKHTGKYSTEWDNVISTLIIHIWSLKTHVWSKYTLDIPNKTAVPQDNMTIDWLEQSSLTPSRHMNTLSNFFFPVLWRSQGWSESSVFTQCSQTYLSWSTWNANGDNCIKHKE